MLVPRLNHFSYTSLARMPKKKTRNRSIVRSPVFDWLNLPQSADTVSLWHCLHDAHIVAIRSDRLQRSMELVCEIEHVRLFHHFPDEWQFVLRLGGVHSARVLRHAIWPGEFYVPSGLTRAEESKMIAEYQAKWREETLTWIDFEGAVSRDNKQIFDISDATLATSPEGTFALQVGGQHGISPTDYSTYRIVSLRAERLEISGSDGSRFGIDQFRSLGEDYWEEFGRHAKTTKEKSVKNNK
jgi:hypothetical protein